MIIVDAEKTCTKCDNTKPLDEFYKFTNGKLGRHSWCKKCMNRDKKRYRRQMKRYLESGTPGRMPLRGAKGKYLDIPQGVEWEFAHAMHVYISRTGDRFPAWSKVLEVLKDLGYKKC